MTHDTRRASIGGIVNRPDGTVIWTSPTRTSHVHPSVEQHCAGLGRAQLALPTCPLPMLAKEIIDQFVPTPSVKTPVGEH
jgi:hypothetical protein